MTPAATAAIVPVAYQRRSRPGRSAAGRSSRSCGRPGAGAGDGLAGRGRADRLEVAGLGECRQRLRGRRRLDAGRHEVVGREAGGAAVGGRRQAGLLDVAGLERAQEHALRGALVKAPWRGVEHDAAADGLAGRERAQDEAVVRLDGGGAAVEPHDRHRRLARGELAAVEEAQVRDVLGRAVVQAHALAGLERPRAADEPHGGRERTCRGDARGRLGGHQKDAALQVGAVGAPQVQGDAAAGGRRLDGPVVHLHAAHRHRLAAGLHHEAVAGAPRRRATACR